MANEPIPLSVSLNQRRNRRMCLNDLISTGSRERELEFDFDCDIWSAMISSVIVDCDNRATSGRNVANKQQG